MFLNLIWKEEHILYIGYAVHIFLFGIDEIFKKYEAIIIH